MAASGHIRRRKAARDFGSLVSRRRHQGGHQRPGEPVVLDVSGRVVVSEQIRSAFGDGPQEEKVQEVEVLGSVLVAENPRYGGANRVRRKERGQVSAAITRNELDAPVGEQVDVGAPLPRVLVQELLRDVSRDRTLQATDDPEEHPLLQAAVGAARALKAVLRIDVVPNPAR
eukprot:scaffold11_cov257-Pinguiococcus_pyrenoidosus.AAC.15